MLQYPRVCETEGEEMSYDAWAGYFPRPNNPPCMILVEGTLTRLEAADAIEAVRLQNVVPSDLQRVTVTLADPKTEPKPWTIGKEVEG